MIKRTITFTDEVFDRIQLFWQMSRRRSFSDSLEYLAVVGADQENVPRPEVKSKPEA